MPAAAPCKSTMAESVLNMDGAARAQAEGLRHGKHSLLPKRVAASHLLQQQQMTQTHIQNQTYRAHTFFFHTEKCPHWCISLTNSSSWVHWKRVNRLRRHDGVNTEEGHRDIFSHFRKIKKLLLNYKMTKCTTTSQQWLVLCTFVMWTSTCWRRSNGVAKNTQCERDY